MKLLDQTLVPFDLLVKAAVDNPAPKAAISAFPTSVCTAEQAKNRSKRSDGVECVFVHLQDMSDLGLTLVFGPSAAPVRPTPALRLDLAEG